jgi:hypothetical protein
LSEALLTPVTMTTPDAKESEKIYASLQGIEELLQQQQQQGIHPSLEGTFFLILIPSAARERCVCVFPISLGELSQRDVAIVKKGEKSSVAL